MGTKKDNADEGTARRAPPTRGATRETVRVITHRATSRAFSPTPSRLLPDPRDVRAPSPPLAAFAIICVHLRYHRYRLVSVLVLRVPLAFALRSVSRAAAASSQSTSSVPATVGGTPPADIHGGAADLRFALDPRPFSVNLPGYTATASASCITLFFSARSASVVAERLGLALTSMSHGFMDSSTRRSYP